MDLPCFATPFPITAPVPELPLVTGVNPFLWPLVATRPSTDPFKEDGPAWADKPGAPDDGPS